MPDLIKASTRLELGLGLLSIGRRWGVAEAEPPEEEAAHALLARALDLGIQVFDTAPAYGPSEARFGRFLAGLAPERRAGIVVMTKAGEHWDEATGGTTVDHGRDALRRSIERSLALLGRVDVLQIHKATPEVVAHPDTLAAIAFARRCGIARIGASVSTVEAGERALETGEYAVLQFPFNAASRGMEPLLAAMHGRGALPVLNRPFAMGNLVAGDAKEQGETAFRFIARHVPAGVVLTGTGKVAHLEANVAAFRSSGA